MQLRELSKDIQAIGRRNNMANEVSAIFRGVRISPQKARLVADLVRGKKVDNALNILTFSPKKGAEIIKKVVESAIFE